MKDLAIIVCLSFSLCLVFSGCTTSRHSCYIPTGEGAVLGYRQNYELLGQTIIWVQRPNETQGKK
jgi:hypothetical protein